MTRSRKRSDQHLRDEIIRLGPWHLEVQVTPDTSTAAWLDAPKSSYPSSWGNPGFQNPRGTFLGRLARLYPDGLEGRSVLDCACNCGAYLFYAKEAGAGSCFGFDVRQHWIKQAEFLVDRYVGPKEDMTFKVCDLYDLPTLGLSPFDITLFNGIFYHLPDPIHGLKIAADLTNEVLILDTATRTGMPDGGLVLEHESQELIMSGIYGLNWLPTGPEVVKRVLNWAGFVDTRLVWWKQRTSGVSGRLEIVASKTPGRLEPFTQPRIEASK